MIDANTKTKKATLVRSYTHPKKLLAPFEGNAQLLPDGHVFVGWGGWPYLTEFDRNGKVVFDAYFGHGKPAGRGRGLVSRLSLPWHGDRRPTPARSR